MTSRVEARLTRALLGAALATLVVFLPRVGVACSVCFDATAANRAAFISTTVFLSVLPLLLIGGLIGWLWRRSRAIQQNAPERRPERPTLAS